MSGITRGSPARLQLGRTPTLVRIPDKKTKNICICYMLMAAGTAILGLAGLYSNGVVFCWVAVKELTSDHHQRDWIRTNAGLLLMLYILHGHIIVVWHAYCSKEHVKSGSYVLVIRLKTRGTPETMVCRIPVLLRSVEPVSRNSIVNSSSHQ